MSEATTTTTDATGGQPAQAGAAELDATVAAAAAAEGAKPADAPATETPPAAEGAKPGEETKPTEEAKPGEEGKPAEVEYKFELPKDTTIAPETVTEFTNLAKETGLSQEQAQKVMNYLSGKKAGYDNSVAALVENTKAQWLEQTKNDKEIGGDKIHETLGYAAKAREAFATDDFKKLLDATGFGNNPEFVRVFSKIGRAISNDTIVTGDGGGASEPKSLATRIYS